ncbi:MAG: class II D-tagatose-bisphosphate aldolase non-catalytic subunit [Paracoccaceae bacterium]
MSVTLDNLFALRCSGAPKGITSVCSAHPSIIRAALRHGRDAEATVLIEATCNQVNHRGGYTGMTPESFAKRVYKIAKQENYPQNLVVLGGDHLGPNPWRDQPVNLAMHEAEKMVAAYVAAGFRKIHLDTSMGCAGEPIALNDETTALRAAQLAKVAERTACEQAQVMPFYIIGTEVPPPGGADHKLCELTPATPKAVRKTIEIHRQIFEQAGLADAFARVIGLVIQPGVEFGNHNVIRYDRAKAEGLAHILTPADRLVFEAHSTDYQGVSSLSELVQDGFAILKVGPELTFILRETFYALDLIASDLIPGYQNRPLKQQMDLLMQETPEHWNGHYSRNTAAQKFLRHYSLSDRIRYYWTHPKAMRAIKNLTTALDGKHVPLPLFWQHMPAAADFADKPLNVEELVIWRVIECLKSYHKACNPALEE